MLRRYGERVHKITIDAAFTCPNRDGSKGRGGCSFCNNVSFSPNGRRPAPVTRQIAAGRAVLAKRTGFDALYRQALDEPHVVDLSMGTRPDCVAPEVLDLLCGYRDQGYELWLELCLQSAFDATLARVKRGHGSAEYRETLLAAEQRGLPALEPGTVRGRRRRSGGNGHRRFCSTASPVPLRVTFYWRRTGAQRSGGYSTPLQESCMPGTADVTSPHLLVNPTCMR
jgi:radical SAM superfamily enzyme